MGQNRSSAVMAQRTEAHDSLDDFPTPPWATRALLEHVLLKHCYPDHLLAEQRVWDPACNRGFMVRPLSEYFAQAQATDIHDYGFSHHLKTVDFLWPGSEADLAPDWVITNPPFRLAERFIRRAFTLSLWGCAFLMRTSFVEGAERHRDLFSNLPPTLIAPFSERVVMHKGKLVNPNVPVPVFDKKKQVWVLRKPTSATSYAWFVWLPGFHHSKTTRMVWIPPCRKQLERAGDYIPEAIS
jgi:hypothetical protein